VRFKKYFLNYVFILYDIYKLCVRDNFYINKTYERFEEILTNPL